MSRYDICHKWLRQIGVNSIHLLTSFHRGYQIVLEITKVSGGRTFLIKSMLKGGDIRFERSTISSVRIDLINGGYNRYTPII